MKEYSDLNTSQSRIWITDIERSPGTRSVLLDIADYVLNYRVAPIARSQRRGCA
jgi:hypothetical protein